MILSGKTFKYWGVIGRLFGVTTLDVVRAARFVSELKNTDPEEENITVIGGHSGVTIVPLLSQSGHDFKGPLPLCTTDVSGDERAALIKRIQFGGDEVVKAKDGAGSATLSMAWAAAKFTDALLRAMQGEKGIIIPTFVQSDLFADKVDPVRSSTLSFRDVTFSLQRWSWVRRELARFMVLENSRIGRRNCWKLVSRIWLRISRRYISFRVVTDFAGQRFRWL